MAAAPLRRSGAGIWLTLTLSVVAHVLVLAYLSGGSNAASAPSAIGVHSVQISLIQPGQVSPPEQPKTEPKPQKPPVSTPAQAEPQLLSHHPKARPINAETLRENHRPPAPERMAEQVTTTPARAEPVTQRRVNTRAMAEVEVQPPSPEQVVAQDTIEPRPSQITTASTPSNTLEPPASATSTPSEPQTVASSRLSGFKQTLVNHLHQALAKHFSYPIKARRRQWEGEVLLRVQIQADGLISDARVDQSSGHRVLDRAAIDSLMRVERLTGIHPDSAIELLLPVRYRLRG